MDSQPRQLFTQAMDPNAHAAQRSPYETPGMYQGPGAGVPQQQPQSYITPGPPVSPPPSYPLQQPIPQYPTDLAQQYPAELNKDMSGYPQQPQMTQPMAQPGMDAKNPKGLPYGADGTREWSNGFFSCFDDCGTCLLSWCCPCIVYAQNKSRTEHIDRQNGPHPSGGDSCNGDCMVHGCLTCCGFGWVLQMGLRGTLRNRYRISGGGFNDCLASCCCTPCELTQEAREIELEESVYRGSFKA